MLLLLLLSCVRSCSRVAGPCRRRFVVTVVVRVVELSLLLPSRSSCLQDGVGVLLLLLLELEFATCAIVEPLQDRHDAAATRLVLPGPCAVAVGVGVSVVYDAAAAIRVFLLLLLLLSES